MSTTAPPRSRRTRNALGARPGAEVVVFWLEGLLAVGAFGGALGFFLLGDDMLRDVTSELPFASPVLAGIALGLVNGVLPTVVLVGGLRRQPWARRGHLVVGVALVTWVVVQVAFLGWPPAGLQWAYAGYGLLIAVLAGRLPAVDQRSVGSPPS
jgi:hypothetical protein